jgi:hypothetical protein
MGSADPLDIGASTIAPSPGSYVAGQLNTYQLAVYNGSLDGEFLDQVRVTFPSGWTLSSLSGEPEACHWPANLAPSGVGTNRAEFTLSGEFGGIPMDCTWLATAVVAVPAGTTGVKTVEWKVWGDEFSPTPPHEVEGSFALSDVVAQPAIAVSPPSLAATLRPEGTAEQILTIRNDGEAALTWGLAEEPPAGWLSEQPADGTVDPGDSSEVTVAFDATGLAPGSYQTVLRVSSNDPATPLVEVAVRLTAATAPAPFRGWLVLDGADDWATAADEAELDLGAEQGESLTVEAWVHLHQFRNGPLVRKGDAYNLYALWQSGMPCLGFSLRSGGNSYQLQFCASVGGLGAPGWHHAAGVFDQAAGQTSLYLDGERVVGPFAVGPIAVNNTGESLQVGFSRSVAESGAELFDEIRPSAVARYAGSSYTVPSTAFDCDGQTRALWHFDEGQGSTLFHDGCGAVDNVLQGHNGAHTEGVPVHRVFLPLVVSQ